MPPIKKPAPPVVEQKRPLFVGWPERDGWQPFTDRLGGLTLGDQGFLTGTHTIEPKRPKGK